MKSLIPLYPDEEPTYRLTFATPPSWLDHLLNTLMYMAVIVACIGVLLITIELWQRRAAVFDKLISALSLGVRAKRRASQSGRSFWQKVIERADQK